MPLLHIILQLLNNFTAFLTLQKTFKRFKHRQTDKLQKPYLTLTHDNIISIH